MIITLADIRKTRDISSSVKEVRVNHFIKDAELVDLMPLIGDVLFQDLLNNPTEVARGNYPDLLNGSTYSYSGYTYTHPGIKNVLADFVYARYRFMGSDIDTPFGTVVKSSQNSQPTGTVRNREIYSAIRKVAFSKWELVKDFLNRSEADGSVDSYSYWFCPSKQLDNDEDEININKITIR